MKNKTLCEISDKTFENEPEKVKELVRHAEFICKRCFRSAKKKKQLCKPEKLNL